MRALLKPVIARELGVVLLKPGSELMSLFSGNRVLVERQPESMNSYATGRVPDALQPLACEPTLRPFFLNEKVIEAAGGLSGLDYWLLNHAGGRCQNEHSDYPTGSEPVSGNCLTNRITTNCRSCSLK